MINYKIQAELAAQALARAKDFLRVARDDQRPFWEESVRGWEKSKAYWENRADVEERTNE